MNRHKALLDGLEDDVAEAENLLNQGLLSQQVNSRLLIR